MRLMTSVRYAPVICISLAAALMYAIAPRSAHATTITWTGATSAIWNTTDANWFDGTNGVAFAIGNDTVFTDNFGSNPTISVPTAGLNPNSVTFSHIAGATPTTYTFDRTTNRAPWDTGGTTTPTSLVLDTGYLGQVLLMARAANTGGGATTIKSGILEIHDGGALPTNGTSNNNPGTVTLAGGTLSIKVDTAGKTNPASSQLNGTMNVTANSTLQNNAINTSRLWLGAINVSSGVTLTITPNASGTAGVIGTLSAVLNGASNLGTIGIGGSAAMNPILELQGTNTQSSTATFDLGSANGVLRTNRGSTTINLGALTGGGSTNLQGSTGSGANITYSIGGANLNAQYNGVISNGTNATTPGLTLVTKVGNGTETLAGADTYSGATTVSAGMLLVTGTHTNAGTYAVNGTGTLGGNGTITTLGNAGVTVASGGKLSPGTSPGTLNMNLGTGLLDISGAVTNVASASMLFDLDTPGSSDEVLLTSANSGLNIGSGVLEFDDFVFNPTVNVAIGNVYTLFDTSKPITGSLGGNMAGSLGGSLTGILSLGDNGQDVLLTVVPEPSAFVLLSLGAVGLLACRRRR